MPKQLDANFSEVLLLPPSVEEWIAPQSPARMVRAFVEEFLKEEAKQKESERKEAERKKAECEEREPEETRAHEQVAEKAEEEKPERKDGRPTYARALLLRVWLYGYARGIRSSRKLEQACREQVEFIWLSGNLQPDHNTLWRFWQKHRESLGDLFRHSVKVAARLNMVGFVLQAVDGTKIQAACSGRRKWDEASLRKLLAKLDEVLEEKEQQIETSADQEEGTGLPEELKGMDAATLREKVAEALQMVESGESRHVHPLEPEARRMQCDGRNRFGYNAQAVVDAQAQVIVAAEVTSEENDTRQLCPMLEKAHSVTGRRAVSTVADGGYGTGEQLEAAHEKGFEVLSPINSDKATDESGQPKPYHTSQFRHDAETNEMICPQGQRLRFVRERIRRGVPVQEYRGTAGVCRACPAFNVCTRDIRGRVVQRWPWTPHLETHREKMSGAVNRAVYQLRSEIVEPVFGWIKEAWSFRRWSFRGLEKVKAQWLLICTAANLRALTRQRNKSTPLIRVPASAASIATASNTPAVPATA